MALLDELLGEESHEETVVPRAVSAALVTTHDADRTKADVAVGADGRHVVGRGIDDQAVKTLVDEKMLGERSKPRR